MKKFVYCIYLLLAACCTTAVAQTTDKPYNILEIEGMVPTKDGSTLYYLKNVGTGLYVSYGGEWGKHCKESRAAHPFIVEDNGNGTVALASLAGYLDSKTIWMDFAADLSKWTLQPVGGKYVNQYYLVGDNGRALTSVGNSAGVLAMTPLEEKASQRWIFLTEEEFQNRMLKATADKPFDATPLIKGAAFDLIDSESDLPQTPAVFSAMQPYLDNYWENYATNKKLDPWHCGVCPENANDYNYCGVINGSNNAITITYTMELPAGTYSYSFEGFYKYMKKVIVQNYRLGSENGDPKITFSDNGTMTATVSVNGNSHALPRHENNAVYEENFVSSTVAAAEFRDNDTYKENGTFYLPSKQDVSIVITKAATTSSSTSGTKVWGDYTTTSYPSQIFIDDFTLLYFGDKQLDEEEINEDALKDSYVDANIDEIIETTYPDLTEEEKEALKEEIKDAVNENEGSGNTGADISDALSKVEETVEELQQEEAKEEATSGITTNENGDMVDDEGNVIEGAQADLGPFIKNASFEDGIINGWELETNSSYTTGVRDNADAEVTTVGTDGGYLFNAGAQGVRLTQTLTKLPKGIHKITVSLASDAGNTVVLSCNGTEREVTLSGEKENDKLKFEDFSIKFNVAEDGNATISLASDSWYRADNFRLHCCFNDKLTLSETGAIPSETDYWYANVILNRTIKANGNWNTFVVPFDIPASMLGGWEIKELDSSELNEQGGITLKFVDAEDGIKAGVPYMVRNQGMTEAMTEILMQNVNISTEPKDVETDHAIFKGVYTKTYVPIGSYFISSNKFYRCANPSNPDYVNGYRAYIEPKESAANARSLGYRFGSRNEMMDNEGTTAIEGQQPTEAPTVVGIYTLGGVRIDDMQEGVNILQMSDGSVVKVVIK
ncbi:MAG: hypothetical protein IKJ18_01420 [Bacteroidaceae bacterium]|nr:hypothetical protein [Bacteroidaceae bacterium]